MTETEKYVRRYLKKAVTEVAASRFASVPNGLDLFEKTLIYHYTGDGYILINRSLRRHSGNKAAALLAGAVQKLPSWQGLVYRTAGLTKNQVARYRRSLKTGIPVMEPTFVSTSKSQIQAREYPNWNVQFRIFSRSGKEIEKCSCLPHEEEVLLLP